MSETEHTLCGSVSLDGQLCILPAHHTIGRHHVGDDGSSWTEGSIADGARRRIAALRKTNADLLEALERLSETSAIIAEGYKKGTLLVGDMGDYEKAQENARAALALARARGEG